MFGGKLVLSLFWSFIFSESYGLAFKTSFHLGLRLEMSSSFYTHFALMTSSKHLQNSSEINTIYLLKQPQTHPQIASQNPSKKYFTHTWSNILNRSKIIYNFNVHFPKIHGKKISFLRWAQCERKLIIQLKNSRNFFLS